MPAEAPVLDAPAAGQSSVPQPFQEAFADLEGMATQPLEDSPSGDKPANQPSRKTGTEQDKEVQQDPEKTEGQDKKPDETPKPEDDKTKTQQTQQKPSKASELRQAYETQKAKLRQLEADLAAKNAELETVKSKPSEDPEKKTLQERLSEREKRLQDLENKIRFKDYQESQEYKEKYYQPFVDAFQTGRRKAASLKISGEDGNVRQGAAEDFDRLVQADDDTAADLAEELFGSKSAQVMYHRERVMELNDARTKAVEDYKKAGSEQEKQSREQYDAHQKRMSEAFKTATTQAIEKYPELFKPTEGDQKGNDLLQKGFALADSALSGLDHEGKPIPPERIIAIHAAVRNRAAGFGRMVHLYRSSQEKIKSLESDLKKYSSSEPGAGNADGKGKVATGSDVGWESELEKLGKPAL